MIKKLDGFLEKFVSFFYKIAKSSKVALQGHWKCKNSRNVQKFGVFLKKGWVFPKRNIPIFQKNDKGSDYAVEWHWISKISQISNVLVFFKKTDRFSEKNDFLKNRRT